MDIEHYSTQPTIYKMGLTEFQEWDNVSWDMAKLTKRLIPLAKPSKKEV